MNNTNRTEYFSNIHNSVVTICYLKRFLLHANLAIICRLKKNRNIFQYTFYKTESAGVYQARYQPLEYLISLKIIVNGLMPMFT